MAWVSRLTKKERQRRLALRFGHQSLEKQQRYSQVLGEAIAEVLALKLVSIFFPGRYEDAFVYMGRLLIFTEERTVRVWHLGNVVDHIQKKHPESGQIPTLMFLRNDWLASDQFKTLTASEGVLTSLRSNADKYPQPYFRMDDDSHLFEYSLADVEADSLLDVLVYNGRLYLSTENGLYQADIDWKSEETDLGPVKKRWEARCVNTSAKLGAVNVSCGNEGLFSAIDEFGLLGVREPALHKTAEKSFKTLWFGNDLINYRTAVEPDLLRNKLTRKSVGEFESDEKEKWVVQEIGSETWHLDGLFDSIHRQYGVRHDSAQFVYNSNRNFFVNTYDRRFFIAGLDETKDGKTLDKVNVRFINKYETGVGHVYSANSTRAGLIIETDFSVQLFAHGKWFPILNAGVLSVRTFMKSRRYQNLVAATSEEGVFLTGIFDDGAE